MKYTLALQIGDQGEHIVARQIIKWFGWPCRLQERDTGIDAEYELTTNNGDVLGKIVKIQVKTTQSRFQSGSNSFYLDERHVNYWKNFSVPVVFLYVSLDRDEILWKLVCSEEDYKSGGEAHKLVFNYPEDLLSVGCKEKLAQIAKRTTNQTYQLLLQAEGQLKQIWADGRLLIYPSESGDEALLDDVESFARHLRARYDLDLEAKADPETTERFNRLIGAVLAARRTWSRRADEDDPARDG
jgi:hypothetical protein